MKVTAPKMKEDHYTLKQGEVVFRWPERIPAEEYEDLAVWLQLLLRKVKRSVQNESQTQEGES